MAGYMTALQGYIYEGELVNGETSTAIKNGMLVTIQSDGNGGLVMKLPAAKDTATKLKLKEITTIYDGIPAYRFVVDAVGTPTYFVENGFDDTNKVEYDLTEWEVAPGKYLRAHPLLVGEEFVTDQVTGTLTVGTQYAVLTTGKIGAGT